MVSTFSSLVRVIPSPLPESWDLTILLCHTALLDTGLVPLSINSKDGETESLELQPDGSVIRPILLSNWNFNNEYMFRYFHPLMTTFLSPRKIIEMKGNIQTEKLKITFSGDITKGMLHEYTITKEQRLPINICELIKTKLTEPLERVPPILIEAQTLAQNFINFCRPLITTAKSLRGLEVAVVQDDEPLRLELEHKTQEREEQTADTLLLPHSRPQQSHPKSDIDPFAIHNDPLRDWRMERPQGIFQPDGNLIGPDHPGFGRTTPFSGQHIGGRGIRPPGARFDPIDPFGRRGGDPDPDHERVPGCFGLPDMYM